MSKNSIDKFPTNSPLLACTWDNELTWANEKIADICHALRLVCLPVTDLDQPIFPSATGPQPDVLLFSLANREPTALTNIEAILRNFDETPAMALLGEWWAGHRRVFPLVSRMQSFYWFELHKLALELASLTASNTRISPNSTSLDAKFKKPATEEAVVVSSVNIDASGAAATMDASPVVSGKRSLLCFSDSSETRNSVCLAAESFGWSAMAIENQAKLPLARPNCVLWEPNAWANENTNEEMTTNGEIAWLTRVRIAYPSAVLIGIQDFPRFSTASRWLAAKLDLVAGSPYDLGKLLEFSSRFSSAALARK